MTEAERVERLDCNSSLLEMRGCYVEGQCILGK